MSKETFVLESHIKSSAVISNEPKREKRMSEH